VTMGRPGPQIASTSWRSIHSSVRNACWVWAGDHGSFGFPRVECFCRPASPDARRLGPDRRAGRGRRLPRASSTLSTFSVFPALARGGRDHLGARPRRTYGRRRRCRRRSSSEGSGGAAGNFDGHGCVLFAGQPVRRAPGVRNASSRASHASSAIPTGFVAAGLRQRARRAPRRGPQIRIRGHGGAATELSAQWRSRGASGSHPQGGQRFASALRPVGSRVARSRRRRGANWLS